jgi:adenylate kinase
MRIIVTGSVGTGKTTIAELLAKKMGFELIKITDIVEKHGLCEGPECEVDIKKLVPLMEFLEEKDDYVIEGHLACEMELPADFIFILRADPEVLEERISDRGYSKEKTKQNLMAEMLDYCTQRTEKIYHKKSLELDTTKRSPKECVSAIMDAVKNKKKKLDSVDYSDALSRMLDPGKWLNETRKEAD